MNTHNTLIWLFLYLHILLRNLVESTDTSPVSSPSSEPSNLSTGPSYYASTDHTDISTVDSTGFGIGWNTFILSTNSIISGTSQLATHESHLRETGPGPSDGTSTESSVTPDISSGESSRNDQRLSLGSGTSTSHPSQGTKNISLYNDFLLSSMIKTLSTLQLIDFIDSLANKLTAREPDYDFAKDLTNFIAKANINTQPILLNITELLSSGEYEWEIINDKFVYTPKQGYGFKLVMQNNTVLWHTKEKKDYATKIECDNKSHTVTLHKSDGNTEEIKFTPEQETSGNLTTHTSEDAPAIKHTTVLNINKLSNRKGYKWRFSNGIVTCTTTDNYGFRLVRQDKTVLWHTINRNHCAKKVECDYNEKTVTIHMLDGTKFEKRFEQEPDANTLITINIQNACSNNEYTYQKIDNFGIFQPLKPFRVKRVINGGIILWSYRDNIHPHAIKVSDKKDGKRSLVLYFMSDNIEFIDPYDDSSEKANEEGRGTDKSVLDDGSESDEEDDSSTDDDDSVQSSGEGTSTTSHQSGSSTESKVKLFKANPSDPASHVELDVNEYNLNKKKKVATYKIADNVICVKIMFDNVLLWEHDPNQHGDKHPKSVDCYLDNETLIINFDDFYILCEEEGGNWVFNITDTSGVKLFVADPDDNSKFVEIPNGQLTVINYGFYNSYEIPEGTNCILLKYNGVSLWQHYPNIQGAIYPKSLDHDTITDTLFLRFEGLDITFKKTDNGWVSTQSGPLAVKFHAVDPNDPNKTIELDTNQVTVTESGDITTFTIADGVNSIGLTYGQDLLWKHYPNQRGGKHPKSLDYDKVIEVLTLKFDGLDMTFARNLQGVWVFGETGPLAVKFHEVDPNDSNNTVELSSDKLTVTESGDITTFTIADNVNSIALTYGPLLLWRHDASTNGGKHPKSLDYNKTTGILVLKFEGFDLTFSKNDQGLWDINQTGISSTITPTPTADQTGSANTEPFEGTSTTTYQIGADTTFGPDDKSAPVTEPTTVPESTPEITTPSTDSIIPVQEQELDSSGSDTESGSPIAVAHQLL